MDPVHERPMRFLSFSDDKDEAKKKEMLQEAASKIEEARVKEKAFNELIDYKPPREEEIDPATDTRPLYERLMERRNKEKEAKEEAQKLSNLVSKLDEDDVDYLNEVAKSKHEEELKKRLEVYDALESKKLLDEKKALDEERKKKESLLGSKMNHNKSAIKSRLSSMIKVRPKDTGSSLENSGNIIDPTSSKHTTMTSPSNQPITDQSKKRPSYTTETNQSCAIKKLTTEKASHIASNSDRVSGLDNQSDKQSGNLDCTCPKNVMKTIGVLPSLPQMKKPSPRPKSSSDDSDDELYARLVPRTRKRK